ncbi:Pig-G, CP2 mannose-ethanolamine phosphotransferase GPI anchor biosynthesis protein Gpi7 [Schizosaccharomyces pombe]|uniref:GPI ethanolamine phosphate transferase 2 n=1 Tax=Schizosaccharomyces pombe (strain 972 / ATCC 24843) TaxID=284812 RepID=GPI7_SCHPO|nr:putative GPI anchor biosynthesis protein Gpi7 [Schizosaccharomyces pombe]Q09782.1 RecName: Full=GPI ethanolamine phosphate transferase 2; AltName: Full=Glycosylphosphatidylinositol-anchor biosynthesis protein 7 [Schizosaccharomyces pombe 972h-]CAA91096.1 GPI anchor biosynthesis protein Gpi7 (predicted) [Schizosaccharomyces pombe]|eukprot:NP_592829.1 putative GPI anchor biosynthesis protein Gpi7 [Schizosaccharomyces pombe]
MRFAFFGIFWLQIFGSILFLLGFFPHKNDSTGKAMSNQFSPPAVIDQVVFVMVDALRADFVFSKSHNMPFTQSLLYNSTHGIGFSAFARSPTVTMPRLKALTTGTIPGFLDVLLNIAESDTGSSIEAQDSWVYQLNSFNKKIEFYGDDTWLKLFPSAFSKFEGTTSFFVSDYTEVDNNVTRNFDHALPSSLSHSWDALILHYLGVDHIGHLYGPSSPLLNIKLLEIDTIISRIYKYLQEYDEKTNTHSLIVLCGDHGMNEVGNHGGSSSGETTAALSLLFPSNELSHINKPILNMDDNPYSILERVEQVDVVPTICLLLGIPIPKGNMGKVLSPVTELWKDTKTAKMAALSNLFQLSLLKNPSLTTSELSTQFQDSDLNDIRLALENLQSQMVAQSSSYSLDRMLVAISILGACSILSLILFRNLYNYKELLAFAPFVVQNIIIVFSSSFIEEEHVIWYFAAVSLSLLQLLNPKTRLAGSLQLFCLSIIKRWNQTGQKYSDLRDIVDDFIAPSTFMKTILCVTSAFMPAIRSPSPINFLSSMFIAFYKLMPIISKHLNELPIIASFDYTFFVRIIWSLLLISFLSKPTFKQLRCQLSLFILLLTRLENMGLYLLYDIWQRTMPEEGTLASVMYYVAEQVAFFSLGNSNSLATVDLSQAYTGLDSYNIFAVGILLFTSVFAGALWWCLHQPKRMMDRSVKTFWIMSSISLTFLCISCFIMRHHLFVWSVFSPKLLYNASWASMYFLAKCLISTIMVRLR